MQQAIQDLAAWIWDVPMLVLLLGSGLFFLIYSRFVPFQYVRHSINILRGKYDDPNSPGQISHMQALSSALSATVGMGNIGGVALAISQAGPGVLFWMWISAFVGMATKYFTCSLAIMYRGKNHLGQVDGGPMYVITEGLGKKWRPLAIFFCCAGMIGCLPIFQANQLTEVVRENIFFENGWATQEDATLINACMAVLLIALAYVVIVGGIKRIAQIAERLVPSMVALYMVSVLSIILLNTQNVCHAITLVFKDAFTGQAMAGGVFLTVLITGTRRAAFSNEAGIGTAPMAHGAARTNEPIREGLVAMLGPAIDTLIVCTCTGLAIILTNSWQNATQEGITITMQAFDKGIPYVGKWLLSIAAINFSITSIFAFAYYGNKCFFFIFKKANKHSFNYFYILSIIIGATWSLKSVISIIDIGFGLMSIPTVLSAIILAPQVISKTKLYILKIK